MRKDHGAGRPQQEVAMRTISIVVFFIQFKTCIPRGLHCHRSNLFFLKLIVTDGISLNQPDKQSSACVLNE